MIRKENAQVIEELLKQKRKKKNIFWVLVATILVSISLIFFNVISAPLGIFMSVYFLVMALLLLPKMNEFSLDINKVNKNDTMIVEGDILAVFPTDENNEEKCVWVLMVNSGEQEYVEVDITSAIGNSLTEGDIVRLNVTPCTKTIIELSLVQKKADM